MLVFKSHSRILLETSTSCKILFVNKSRIEIISWWMYVKPKMLIQSLLNYMNIRLVQSFFIHNMLLIFFSVICMPSYTYPKEGFHLNLQWITWHMIGATIFMIIKQSSKLCYLRWQTLKCHLHFLKVHGFWNACLSYKLWRTCLWF